MTPRAYTLRRRAQTAGATRQRIVDAATEVYRERGVAAATIGAVAERADVSRGTVLHHFGDADGLLGAVLDHVLATVDLPDERVLTEGAPRDQRIREFVRAMGLFYERSNSWWEVFRADMERPVLKAREQEFWASFGRLYGAALGAAAEDRLASTTVGALLHPWMYGQLRFAGLSVEETIEVIADLVVDLVHRHEEVGRSGVAGLAPLG